MTEVEFRLLGAMQLRVDDEPAKLPGVAERGLLALLLLSPCRTVAASSLIDRLWSESALASSGPPSSFGLFKHRPSPVASGQQRSAR